MTRSAVEAEITDLGAGSWRFLETKQPTAPSAALRQVPRKTSRRKDVLIVGSVLVVVVGIWELLTATGAVSKLFLPSPWSSVLTLWDGLIRGSAYRFDVETTFEEMALGYLVGASIGLTLGTLLASSKYVERAILPYVVFLQTVPLVAVAPLLLTWFGFGLTSKVVTVVLVVIFPVTVNTLAGLKATPRHRLDLMRSFDASPSQLFFKVKLPAAAPFIFTGLDIGIVYSPVGAIVAEFLGANHGIGIAIFQSEQNFDISGVFALLLLLGVTGITLHFLMLTLRRRIVFWEKFSKAREESPTRAPKSAASRVQS